MNNYDDFSGSILGTKQYWEDYYNHELKNFVEFGDRGETWFGKLPTKQIITWIVDNIPRNDRICDIGCGNGLVLGELSKYQYSNLYGLDYSSKSIEFCENLFKNQKIHFEKVDILEDGYLSKQKFNVILDKGTFDAISLMPDSDANLNRSKYVTFLMRHLQVPDGYFIIFSCNFTRDEIITFIQEHHHLGELRVIQEFESPRFSFGGQSGQQVTGLVFQSKI
ncbi:Protein-lysine N-methyltransferase efm4 [Sarcoptes scabiei]|uniref:Protein-lysine N-methyltransferase SSS_4666 n=1 Tax=Sarcoptes scabiei TaxID=52283 RepID=A0A834VHE3_SARSC|nr:Protein-lysine N-methyltransferase efm4 [Sarcoptes scabiei]UXI21340.1 PRKCA-binding protein-like [Sarcoptes scabiei]